MAASAEQARHLSATLNDAGKSAMTFSSNVGRGGITLENFGSIATNAAKKVAVWQFAIASVYGVMKKAGEVQQDWKDLELTLARISVTTGAMGDKLNQYFNQVAKVAIQFGMPIKETLTGMDLALRSTASLGNTAGRAATAVKLLSDASVLANLTGWAYSKSMDTLVGSLRQTGMSLDSGLVLLDKWTLVAKMAQVSVADMAQGFSIMADAADAAGLSVDQINGLIAGLGEAVPYSPTQIANSIRAIMSTTYNDKSVKVLQSYGVAVKNATGEARNFWDIMMQLSSMKELGVLNENQWLDIARAMGGGSRQYANVMALISRMPVAMSVATQSAVANGQAMDANAKIVGTLANAWDQFKASQDQFFFNLGAKTGAITGLTSTLQMLTRAFVGLAGTSPGIFTLVRALTAMAGTLGAAKLASLAWGWLGGTSRLGGLVGRAANIEPWRVAGNPAAQGYMNKTFPARFGMSIQQAAKEAKKPLPEYMLDAGIGAYPAQTAQARGTYALSGFLRGTRVEQWRRKQLGNVTPPTFEQAIGRARSTNMLPKIQGAEDAAYISALDRWKFGEQGGLLTRTPEGQKALQDIIKLNKQQPIQQQLKTTPVSRFTAADPLGLLSRTGTVQTLNQIKIGKKVIPVGTILTSQQLAQYQGTLENQYREAVSKLAYTQEQVAQKALPKLMSVSGVAKTVGTWATRATGFKSMTAGLTGAAAGVGVYALTKDKLATAGAAFGTYAGMALGGPIGAVAGVAIGTVIGLTASELFMSKTAQIKRFFADMTKETGLELSAVANRYIAEIKSAAKNSPQVAPVIPKSSEARTWGILSGETLLKFLGIIKERETDWSTGLGALPYLGQARMQNMIDEKTFQGSITYRAGQAVRGQMGPPNPVPEIDWVNMSAALKAYVTASETERLTKGVKGREEDYAMAVVARKEAEMQLKTALALSDVDSRYGQIQKRAIEIAKELNLEQEAGNRLKEVGAQVGKLSTEALLQEQSALSALVPGYSYYRAQLEALAKQGQNLTPISLDTWLSLQKNAPDLFNTITSSIEEVLTKSHELDDFTAQYPSLAEKFGINQDINSIDALRQKMTDIQSLKLALPEGWDMSKIQEIIDQIDSFLKTRSLLLPSLQQSLGLYNEAGAGFKVRPEVRTFSSTEDFNKAVAKLSELDRMTKLAEGLGQYGETERVAYLDLITGNTKELHDINTVALSWVEAMNDNTAAQRDNLEYNLPNWYTRPSKYWLQQENQLTTFGPATDEMWSRWEQFMQQERNRNKTEVPKDIIKVDPLITAIEALQNAMGIMPEELYNQFRDGFKLLSTTTSEAVREIIFPTGSQANQVNDFGESGIYPTAPGSAARASELIKEIASSTVDFGDSVSKSKSKFEQFVDSVSNYNERLKSFTLSLLPGGSTTLPFPSPVTPGPGGGGTDPYPLKCPFDGAMWSLADAALFIQHMHTFHPNDHGTIAGVTYARGTPYVPTTGTYGLHEGERVIPAAENRILSTVLARPIASSQVDLSGTNNILLGSQNTLSMMSASVSRMAQDIAVLKQFMMNNSTPKTGLTSSGDNFNTISKAGYFGQSTLGLRRS